MPESITIYLSHQDIELARTVAAGRADAGEVRRGEGVKRGSLTPFQVEYMGMLGEVATARHYGVEPYRKIERSRSDGGADITVGNYTVDVKATTTSPNSGNPKQPHLIVPNKDVPHDIYLSAYVVEPLERGVVYLLGYATRRMVLQYPLMPFKTEKLVRAVPNDVLRPIRRIPKPEGALAPSSIRPDLTDELDYQRCRKLNGAIDVPNGVVIPKLGKRGTLINALVSTPGFPPGVRVVLEHEGEIVKNSDTKANPAGTPISRDFYSADVKVIE